MIQQFIDNEKKVIQDDFEKAFYYLIAMIPFLREMIFTISTAAKKGKDYTAVKHVGILSKGLSNLMFSIEQFESKFKVESNRQKEEIRSKLKERIDLVAICLSRMPVEQHPDFIAMLHDFAQGNYKHIDESLLDAILDIEDENTVEGLQFIHRINPGLPVDEKESFAKELVNWSNHRNERIKILGH